MACVGVPIAGACCTKHNKHANESGEAIVRDYFDCDDGLPNHCAFKNHGCGLFWFLYLFLN